MAARSTSCPYNTVAMASDSDRKPLRLAIALGGGLVFAGSLLYFTWQYAFGFDAPAADDARAFPNTIDLLLFTAFAMHHSLFARSGFKAALTRVVPPALERTTYVWIASVMFIAVCALWQPVAGVVWRVEGAGAGVLRVFQLAGVVFTLASARHLDILDLSGIRAALNIPSNRPMKLDEHGPYGLVRHPIYLGWIFMVWPAPFMNGTRLVFAAISTLYLVVAIPYEERDLHRTFGEAYQEYAGRVRYKVLPKIY
jgi:protein-S-isoprenylcysteine O-methyltransferase Ste14